MLTLLQADEPLLAECLEVFPGSELYERYFKDSDRLARSLRTAVGQGELYAARAEDGELVGVMRVSPRGFCGLYPYLSLIGVKAGRRGGGVGRFLMNELEALARKSGAARVTLMVSDFNTEAQAFYRALGYWQLGLLPNAAKPGIDELVMVKDL